MFVGMLRLDDCTETAREAAAGALWNLMIDTGSSRAVVIASGGATALVDLVRDVLRQLIHGQSQRALGGSVMVKK